jgi:hypothetical protein
MDEKALIENKIKCLYPKEQVKLLAEGGMSFACEVGENIIRVPKNEYATEGYRIEEKVLIYLRDKIKSVEIPNINIIEEPFFHTIHKKLEGFYWDGNVYAKKTEKEKDLLANDCALFFAELHSADVNKINAKLREIRPIKYNIEKYLTQYFSTREIDKIVDFTNVLYSLQDKCLIHNDFYYDNFFLDCNFRLKCVIDFANGGYFNHNFDFRKIVSYEKGERDFWERIVKFYERLTYRKIEIEIIRVIDIHNYISFLVYFAKNPEIKEEKIGIRDNWNKHIEHIKDKMRKYKIV